MPNYSNFKHHDPAISNTKETINYRKYLIKNQIESKEKSLLNIIKEENQLSREIQLYQTDKKVKEQVLNYLISLCNNFENVTKARIIKKLNTLYNGYHCFSNTTYGSRIMFKEHNNRFINLSDYEPTQEEIKVLNLGLNCHIQPKYDPLIKKTEMEILFQNIIKLEEQDQVITHPDLANYLRAESCKNRYVKTESILTPDLHKAAQSLKNNKNIVIRKADKASLYVILNKEEYHSKINCILSDTTKFVKINKDPTNSIKTKVNKLITTLNATNNELKISKIIGDYEPGYIYGNVKTHKPNQALRPIISQVLTPTYEIAKTLNAIMTPYIPNTYMLNSTNQFIDLLKSSTCIGYTASLDVESLFTNVPVDETIEIIVKHVYNHITLAPPKIPELILRELLSICTKEMPFKTPDGSLYKQTDGVAMGSPLGPLFANFYMGDLETNVFNSSNVKPHIYARYVDDIFIQVENDKQISDLKLEFEKRSVLKFTIEKNVQNKIPFLDVNIDTSNNTFKTTVHRKSTNMGFCLNADSECTEKYKTSVISSYITRAFKITTTWNDFHHECQIFKQILINNNFSNSCVDKQIEKFLKQKMNQKSTLNKKSINIYYKNQMHKNYLKDERILKNIIKNNVKSKDEKKKIKLNIYYKNLKTSNLILKNNPSLPTEDLDKNNVIYEFKCPLNHGKSENDENEVNYIGMTTTKLTKRLNSHKYNGSIKNHLLDYHNKSISKEILENNTKIINKATSRKELYIKEALLIQKNKPIINQQYNSFNEILKLNPNTYFNSRSKQNSILNSNTNGRAENLNNNNNAKNSNDITEMEIEISSMIKKIRKTCN